ncbi:MAG: hypothetical protein ACLUE8_14435 [Lachnospiraceae bacterium]
MAVAEGANMPTTPEAIEIFQQERRPLRPGQGGQRRRRGHQRSGDEPELACAVSWTFDEVDEKLEGIMANIFAKCAEAAKEYGDKPTNYVIGANIAGFLQVADAMMAQGNV